MKKYYHLHEEYLQQLKVKSEKLRASAKGPAVALNIPVGVAYHKGFGVICDIRNEEWGVCGIAR